MVRIRYIKYTHYTIYGSCLPIYGIAIIRSLSFLFLHDFEGSAEISVAIKSDSTVLVSARPDIILSWLRVVARTLRY